MAGLSSSLRAVWQGCLLLVATGRPDPGRDKLGGFRGLGFRGLGV